MHEILVKQIVKFALGGKQVVVRTKTAGEIEGLLNRIAGAFPVGKVKKVHRGVGIDEISLASKRGQIMGVRFSPMAKGSGGMHCDVVYAPLGCTANEVWTRPRDGGLIIGYEAS